MRTTQHARCLHEEIAMLEIKNAIVRNRMTLAQDFLGAAALVSVFVVSLSLPAFF